MVSSGSCGSFMALNSGIRRASLPRIRPGSVFAWRKWKENGKAVLVGFPLAMNAAEWPLRVLAFGPA